MDTNSFFKSLFNSQDEPIFKSELLILLRKINQNWIDGDAEHRINGRKKVDIVNHTLKIALELKMEDASERLESLSNNTQRVIVRDLFPLGNVPNRYSSYMNSCENKFINYSDYKTLLLVRTNMMPLSFIKNWVFEKCNVSKEIGMLLLINADERSVRYALNEYANQNKKMSVQELRGIFGMDISEF